MSHELAYRKSIPAGIVLLLLVAHSPGALAISDEEIFRDFPFNLVNPGARALGVGGAFISQADDSTAAQANPAGLMNLRRPELFAELRSRQYDGSSVFTAATLDGQFFQGDLTASASSEPDSDFSPAFLSYVLPFDRVAIGFSRLESLNIQTRTGNSFTIVGTEAIVDVEPSTGNPDIIGFQPVDFELTAEADVEARIVQYNFALAFDLHRRFSLGLTAVAGTADINGRVDNLFRDRVGGMFVVPTLDYATRIDDSDTDFAYNVGMLWRPADWANIGAVYRKGLRFALVEQVLSSGVRAQEAQELYGPSFDNVVHTPDSYGLGLSFRPSEPWTVLVDVVRVEYSDLMEDYASGLNRITFPDARIDFVVDDGYEYHVGLERILLSGTTPIALRLGAWSDADHRIRADESSGLSDVFPEGDQTTHYTAGFGATINQSIQLDFAADVSSVNTSVVFSTIYRF